MLSAIPISVFRLLSPESMLWRAVIHTMTAGGTAIASGIEPRDSDPVHRSKILYPMLHLGEPHLLGQGIVRPSLE
jgi:hypothetical protein